MDENIAITLLKEFREFRTENDKRWEENDRRWEENNKRWEENAKRWEENNKRWEENAKRWDVNDKTLKALNTKIDEVNKNTNERIDKLEKVIKKDRIDLAGILDTMQKTITEQFQKQQDYMDAKFEKIYSAQRTNEIEHERIFQILNNHEKRINHQNDRINRLEQWKDEMDLGEFSAV